jgi:hypothetical protein
VPEYGLSTYADLNNWLNVPHHFDQRHYHKVESRIIPPTKRITPSASPRSKARMTSSLTRPVLFEANPTFARPTSPSRPPRYGDPNFSLSSRAEYIICGYPKRFLPASWDVVAARSFIVDTQKAKDEILVQANNYRKRSPGRIEITEWKFGSGRKKDWRHYNVFRPFCKSPAVSCQHPKSANKLLLKLPHQRVAWNHQHELGTPVHIIPQCFTPARKFRHRLPGKDKKRHSKFRVDPDDYLIDRDNFNVLVRRWVLAEHVEAGAN